MIDFLYLDQITLQEVPKLEYTLRLFAEDRKKNIQTKDNRTWTPVALRPNVSPTTKMSIQIEMKTSHLPWAKKEEAIKDIDVQNLFNDYWNSKEHKLKVLEVIDVGEYRCTLELQFSANATAESLRSSLKELEELLERYSIMMDGPTEKVLGTLIKYGAVFAELNPVASAVIGLAGATFEILKEQNKFDQMPSVLLDRLKRILPLADKVVDDLICKETEILEKIVPRMFEVMQWVAKFSCDYVKHARTVGGLVYQETIEEMDRELTKVIEDFDRAVNVEALRLAKEAEQQFLLERLEPVKAGYDLDSRCMEGTRESILRQIMSWVADPQERNTYWFYGSPGIGKTSLAHSICASLHTQGQLAGAFFCRRDDPNLSKPRNILPTLINKLAGIFPPFRSIVAKHLRNDPNLTPESMKGSLFLGFIRDLPRQPKHDLVFVIDALDECGDHRSRPVLLHVLTDAASHAPWLKIIITSRPEDDIQRFFSALTGPPSSSCDLATDQEASADVRTFAQSEFDLIAHKWCLPTPWPEESLFDRLVYRASGLFIFIKTVILALEQCEDLEKTLSAALQDSAGTGLKPLYELYSNILKVQRVPRNVEFQQMIGVLLTTAPYRPLREETIAELAGLRLNLVRKWVNDLSSLLYRDEGANGGIRVRHLSISEFFISDHCAYQINLRDANLQLGISCLRIMVQQLRFNICKLEDSRLANAEVKDLPSRIKENISDPLQYSSLYWSNHLCFTPDTGDQRVWGGLKEFFEGLYPLLWIEVLSILGMVPIGAPSLRRVIPWAEGADSTVLQRVQDICRFLITFRTPISISAPHIYISTRPFLPSDSPLSTIFSMQFTKAIGVQRGKLLSWPAPPLQWIGHTQTISCVRYSPNGCQIISGSNDKTIRIWDVETGTMVGEPLKGHTGYVRSVAYSPDGRHIISGANDMTIRIWDADTGATVGNPLKGHTNRLWSVAYSPNGQYIISGGSDKTIRIWDAETGEAVGNPLSGHTAYITSIVYSPDGRYIISGSGDKTIRIWDAETGAENGNPLEGHTGHVLSVAYSRDGRHIISGSSDTTIRIWDAESGAAVRKPLEGHTDIVHSVAYSPKGHRIISGSSDGTIRIWDAVTGAAISKPLEGHTYHVYSVAYSPDGQHIISGSGDISIRMWDIKTGAAAGNPIEGHTSMVQFVAHSPDGRYVASGSVDRTIRIWDAQTGAAVGNPLKGHTGIVRCIAYSPNGQHIISGSDDTTIRIWGTGTGAVVGGPLEGHTSSVGFIAYSPSGQHIISGSDATIRICDAKTGAAVGKPLTGHTGLVRSAVYSSDGRHIISGSNDTTIRIWDVATNAVVSRPLEGHTDTVWSVAYSPDGQRIISGSQDRTIRIWDANTGAAIGKPLKGHADYVRTVAYSPNGSHIVSGSGDSTIQIWDAKTGAALGNPLKGHLGVVRSIVYSPDGRRLVSGAFDGTIHVWDSSPHIPVQHPTLCNPIHTDLCAQPDAEGWVRDSKNGLLYWVPQDCRIGLHSPALLTIPPTSHTRSVSLDFENFAFGTSWTQIFEGA